ncbi:hypothetical protein [Flavobacterium akiainvivens]|uniref:hypothetical protein n=1 Tax=Flavobacterium akiainvivens TaxID=1202724 RepID=UPI000A576495|nr:hypothetical protein [Flavobacterium akiainvivens]
MKKHRKLIGITAILSGFVLNGLGWTVLPGPFMGTVALILGPCLIFGGIFYLLVMR